jgi:hypothetical protein
MGCADLIKAVGVLRQSPTGQAGYMCADRFDIAKKKLAKGVGSIHVAVRKASVQKQYTKYYLRNQRVELLSGCRRNFSGVLRVGRDSQKIRHISS